MTFSLDLGPDLHTAEVPTSTLAAIRAHKRTLAAWRQCEATEADMLATYAARCEAMQGVDPMHPEVLAAMQG